MQRAVRCCPQSGELWARLLRHYEILKQDPAVIGETYMDALALGVLTRKGARTGKRKEKGKGRDKKKGKGKADAAEEEEIDSTERDSLIALGDAKGADVAELAALEAAWAGYMRRMEEANADQGESFVGLRSDCQVVIAYTGWFPEDDDDKEDAVEITLREGLARCRERKLLFWWQLWP